MTQQAAFFSKGKSSKKARMGAARLAAVQAVYQMMANRQDARGVIEEFVARRLGKPMEGHDMIIPDGAHFTALVEGVATRKADLEMVLAGALDETKKTSLDIKSDVNEPLLKALLLCGAYELMAFHDIDAPIVISDYINVAHAFFEAGETRLVNGVLDRVRQGVRD